MNSNWSHQLQVRKMFKGAKTLPPAPSLVVYPRKLYRQRLFYSWITINSTETFRGNSDLWNIKLKLYVLDQDLLTCAVKVQKKRIKADVCRDRWCPTAAHGTTYCTPALSASKAKASLEDVSVQTVDMMVFTFVAVVVCLKFIASFYLEQLEPTSLALNCLVANYTTPKFKILNLFPLF